MLKGRHLILILFFSTAMQAHAIAPLCAQLFEHTYDTEIRLKLESPQSFSEQMLQKLLDKGLPVNAKIHFLNGSFFTPMALMGYYGSTKGVEILIDKGADPHLLSNRVGMGYYSPLANSFEFFGMNTVYLKKYFSELEKRREPAREKQQLLEKKEAELLARENFINTAFDREKKIEQLTMLSII